MTAWRVVSVYSDGDRIVESPRYMEREGPREITEAAKEGSSPLHAYGDSAVCRTYWGSHGCDRPRGHDGPHLCLTCWTPDEDGWVGAPPYYGPDTTFYGEDASTHQPIPLSTLHTFPDCPHTRKEWEGR